MVDKGFLKSRIKGKISYRHYNNSHDRVIVVVHGFYNSKDSLLLSQLCTRLSKRYDVFIFDLRGHGKSSGLFTWGAREGEDLITVLNHLKNYYCKISIIAFSMGGSITINVLAEGEAFCDSFICVSAPCDCSKIDYKLWKLDWENDIAYSLFTKEGRFGKGVRPGPFWLAKSKPIDNVGDIKCPVLYIHGDKDWVVDKWHSHALYEKTASKKKLVIIKDGPHAEYLLKACPEDFCNVIESWLG
ncbi:MAG: alpha/beta fold hydrolase [Candidatus Omnitrophica bacterium]|nr:alpha/beta fold hydrolase [Candidatus Omnitrophota bacterium]MBD3268862.1 alpha/beta fold hydrolase [Candidatus Omnitrophota bacterium]